MSNKKFDLQSNRDYRKNEVKEYIGSTGNTFKTRFNQHKSSFRTKNKSTELAKYIADLEAGKTKFEIKWNILQKIKINSTTGVNGCTLCNLERLELARADRRKALNKRNELQSRCPHNKGNFFLKDAVLDQKRAWKKTSPVIDYEARFSKTTALLN